MPSSLDLVSAKNYSGVSIPSGGVAGDSASSVANYQKEINKFQSLLDGIQAGMNTTESTLSSSQVTESDRLNGEYISSLAYAFTNPADKKAKPTGAAINSAGAHGYATDSTIDKSSKLYQAALELESYFVKIMLSSMRNTVTKTNLLGDKNQYAQEMYEDMLYDELATSMTKSAGFGLADQVYLQMKGNV